MLLILSFLAMTQAAFDSFGCFDRPTGLIFKNISNPSSQESPVENCANECIRSIANFTLVTPDGCLCGNGTGTLVQVPPQECLACSPEPCGSETRISVYLNDLTTVIDNNTETGGRAVDKNIGTDAGLDQRLLALYISAACLAIIIALLFYVWYKRRLTFHQTPSLPRLEVSKGSQEELIPGLEKTQNMTYTVITPYRKKRADELELKVDDVVKIHQIKKQWAFSANLKTGERGLHPLTCFLQLQNQQSV
jgi:SH3 domain